MEGKGHAGTGKARDGTYVDGRLVGHTTRLTPLKAASLTTTPTARASDAQAELDHLTGDAGGLEGEADGLEGWHGRFPKN